MNVDSDDYGDANFVTGLIIQDIYPDDGVQYGGGHTVCANDADLGTVGLAGGICRPDPNKPGEGICDDGLECRDGRCRTKPAEEESSDVTDDAVAPINYNCFKIPNEPACAVLHNETRSDTAKKLFTTGTSCNPGTVDEATMLYEITQLNTTEMDAINGNGVDVCQIDNKPTAGDDGESLEGSSTLERIAKGIGIINPTEGDSPENVSNKIMANIYSKQGEDKDLFTASVRNTWNEQVKIPTQWSTLLKSTYGDKAEDHVFTELRERKAGEIQMEVDKRMNEQVNRYHSLTELAIQTQFSKEKDGAINGFIGKQRSQIEKNIRKASADVMSTDRQVQINHNNAEKIVLETKRLRIIFVATIVSIIIVSIGLLDIGVSFILALVSVILIYLFALYLLSKSYASGERSPHNTQELQFKPLTDKQLQQASSATEEVSSELPTGTCTVVDKNTTARDNCREEHLCLPVSADESDMNGICYHKDHPEAQKSSESRLKDLELERVRRELANLQAHHTNPMDGYHNTEDSPINETPIEDGSGED